MPNHIIYFNRYGLVTRDKICKYYEFHIKGLAGKQKLSGQPFSAERKSLRKRLSMTFQARPSASSCLHTLKAAGRLGR